MKAILEIDGWTKEIEINSTLYACDQITVCLFPPMSKLISMDSAAIPDANKSFTSVILYYVGLRKGKPVFVYK